MSLLRCGMLLIVFALAACSPEVGSKAWCEAMKDKPTGEWSANDTTDFAKHCLFGGGD